MAHLAVGNALRDVPPRLRAHIPDEERTKTRRNATEGVPCRAPDRCALLPERQPHKLHFELRQPHEGEAVRCRAEQRAGVEHPRPPELLPPPPVRVAVAHEVVPAAADRL